MRVIFMGTPEFAVPTLQALHRVGHEIVLVVSQPDKPAGRGQKLTSPPVAEAARALGLPLAQPVALKKGQPGTPEFRAALRDAFEQAKAVPVSNGVLDYTAEDHWGFPPDTGVMLKVVNGDWQLEK